MPSGESVPPKVVKAIFYLRAEGKRWKDIGIVFKEKEDWARWIAKRYSKDTGLSLKGREQSGFRLFIDAFNDTWNEKSTNSSVLSRQ